MKYMLIFLFVCTVFFLELGNSRKTEHVSSSRKHRQITPFEEQRTCKRQIEDLRTLFTMEVSRLDAKVMDLMNTDKELKEKDEDLQLEWQQEVTRLDEKDNELMQKDKMMMEKNAYQDKVHIKLFQRDTWLLHLFKDIKGELDDVKEEQAELKEKVHVLQEENADLKQVIDILKAKALQKAAFDGFNDGRPFDESVAVGGYSDERVINLGGFFDIDDGTFTAFCTGLYRISVGILTIGNNPPVTVCLRVNGVLVPGTQLNPQFDAFASLTTILRMNEGDMLDIFSKVGNAFGAVRFTGELVHCLNSTVGLSAM